MALLVTRKKQTDESGDCHNNWGEGVAIAVGVCIEQYPDGLL